MKIPVLHGHGGTDVYAGSSIIGMHPDLSGSRAPWVSSGDNRYKIILPCAGTFSHHLVDVKNAAASGNSFYFGLNKNGINALAITIPSPSTSGSNVGSSLAVVAGDLVYGYGYGSASSGNTRHRTGLLFEPSTEGVLPFWTGQSSTSFMDLYGHSDTSTEERTHCLVPIPGKFKNLYLYSCDGAVTSGVSVTLRKNGVSAALAATIPNGSISASDLYNEVSFAAGDIVDLYMVNSTGESVTVALCFVSDDPKLWFMSTCKGYTSFSTSVLYNYVNGGLAHTTSSWQTPEDSGTTYDFRCIWPSGPRIRGIAAALTTAPGAGKSRTFTLRHNTADTVIAVTLSDADTYKAATGFNLCPADFDLVSLVARYSGSVAPSRVSVALIGERPADASHTPSMCIPRSVPALFIAS